jgi:RNA polymerase sigma factor (sigma-70 family)
MQRHEEEIMDPESLLARARMGDQQAWNDLLVLCRPKVRAQLKRALPDMPDDASELTNNVQMNMTRGFPAFRGEVEGQFIAWAVVITKNVLYHYFRDGRRLPTLVPLPPEHLCPQPEVCDQVIEAEDLDRLADALENLPERYRKVIKARLFSRRSTRDIAEDFGWARSTVSVFTKRAVELLASKLREKS